MAFHTVLGDMTYFLGLYLRGKVLLAEAVNICLLLNADIVKLRINMYFLLFKLFCVFNFN